jgi:hypothetical protein
MMTTITNTHTDSLKLASARFWSWNQRNRAEKLSSLSRVWDHSRPNGSASEIRSTITNTHTDSLKLASARFWSWNQRNRAEKLSKPESSVGPQPTE